MKISVIIPVCNEVSTIEEIVKRVKNVPLELDKEHIKMGWTKTIRIIFGHFQSQK